MDPRGEYLVAINSIFHEIAADGVETFHRSPCERTHPELIRDVVARYLRVKRSVSGEHPGRLKEVLRDR